MQPRKHHGKVTRYVARIQEHDIIVQVPSCLHTHALFSTAAKRKNGSRRTSSRRGGLTAPMAAHWKGCATIVGLPVRVGVTRVVNDLCGCTKWSVSAGKMAFVSE